MSTPSQSFVRSPVGGTESASADHARGLQVLVAWVSILLISDLPDIISSSFFRTVPDWMFWAKLGVLGVLLVSCLTLKRLGSLRQFAVVMLVFYLALAASSWVGASPVWKARFAGPQVSFTAGYFGVYVRDTGVALSVIATLWFVKRHRSAFFLVRGRLDAPIQPVRWLGIKSGESWRTFGWIITGIAGLGTLGACAYGLPLSLQVLLAALPLLPAGILFAAINAFNEEIYYRASLLSTLPDIIGNNSALLINAVFFGLAHFLYGSPSGVLGFAMAGFLGWLLGKSILETKGLWWAWFIHFVMDVIVFTSYAVHWAAR